MLAPDPPRKSHPSERHFYCSCLSAMYPSSRSEEIQMLWMTKSTCRKMKLALSSQVQEWGWLRECGWNKEVGNSRVFSQSHGRPEGRCWPRAHVGNSKDPCHRFSSLASVAAALLDPSFLCEAAQPSLFTKLQKCWGEGDSTEKVSWELRTKGFGTVKNIGRSHGAERFLVFPL